MSCCVSIRVLNKKSITLCENYKVIAAGTSNTWLRYQYDACFGETVTAWLQGGTHEFVCVKAGAVPFKIQGDSGLNVVTNSLCNQANTDKIENGYLDLHPNFNLQQTKRVSEVTELDKLKITFTLNFSIPNTSNNYNLLKNFINSDVLDNDFKEIEVEVKQGSYIIPESSLYVTKASTNSIEVTLRMALNHWGRLAGDLKLKELQYPDIIWNENNLNDIVDNQYPYNHTNTNFDDSNNAGVWFPLADYGRTIPTAFAVDNNRYVQPIEWWRPYYYVTGVLQRGFCLLGWEFKSPFFKSAIGDRLLCYLMAKDFGIGEDIGRLKVRAKLDEDFLYSHLGDRKRMFKFDITEFNSFGVWDVNKNQYFGSGEVNIKGRCVIKGATKKNEITLKVGHVTLDIDVQKVYHEQTFTNISQTDNTVFEFDLKNIACTELQGFGVQVIQPTGQSVLLVAGSFIEFNGVRSYFKKGNAYSLNNIIDSKYNFLDFVKGLAHAFNLKLVTNFNTKTVSLFTPYDADFWGEDIEGFFIEETVLDITSKLVCNSEKEITPKLNDARYLELAYKKTNNKYLERFELKDELFSKKIDLGEKFKNNKTTKITNRFFTAAIFDNGLLRFYQKNEHTFKIDPVLLLGFGNVIQELPNDEHPIKIQRFDFGVGYGGASVLTELIPTAAMFVPYKIGDTHNDVNSGVFIPKENLIYDVNNELNFIGVVKSLYDLVYFRYFLEKYNNIKINILTKWITKDFVNFDFRRLYKINHKGKDIITRIDSVSDFHYCGESSTPTTYIPLRQLSDMCGLLPDNNGLGGGANTPDECVNNPLILYTISGDCYNFVISGDLNAPIVSVLFEWRLTSSMTWNTLTNLTVVSAQLCGQTEDYYIRATIVFGTVDGVVCPSVMTTETLISPCLVDYVDEVICSGGMFDNELKGWLIIYLNTSKTVTVVSAEVNADGQGFQAFTMIQEDDVVISDPPITGENLVFNVDLQFDNCPITHITKECTITDEPNIPSVSNFCDKNNIYLECTKDSNNCFVFNKKGTIFGDYDDYIKYRCSSDGVVWLDDWKIWDNMPVCCNYVQAVWYVHFCNDICPFLCSPLLECNVSCTTPFQTGTIQPQALCNTN